MVDANFFSRVRDIPSLVRKAMQIAQSDTPGPVFVEFPIDTLYPYPTIKKEVGLKVRKLSYRFTLKLMIISSINYDLLNISPPSSFRKILLGSVRKL